MDSLTPTSHAEAVTLIRHCILGALSQDILSPLGCCD